MSLSSKCVALLPRLPLYQRTSVTRPSVSAQQVSLSVKLTTVPYIVCSSSVSARLRILKSTTVSYYRDEELRNFWILVSCRDGPALLSGDGKDISCAFSRRHPLYRQFGYRYDISVSKYTKHTLILNIQMLTSALAYFSHHNWQLIVNR